MYVCMYIYIYIYKSAPSAASFASLSLSLSRSLSFFVPSSLCSLSRSDVYYRQWLSLSLSPSP